ncbi:MAG: ABC transporter ATP-binding protein [Fimbriimonas sp.]
MSNMIEVKKLSHRFDTRDVLKEISLSVAEGEVLAVMGSSGGGKTTLLRCIAGLIVATAGEIEVAGLDVRTHPEEVRRHMGMVFQSAALFDSMSVLDNVLFGLRRHTTLSAKDAVAKANESLAKVGLESAGTKLPSELSGGMRKRVGIARAIALEPRVLLYDEPTTGLDPVTTYAIDSLMVELQKELGVTSIIVSHDLNSVFRTAHRVAFLHQGSLVFDGPPADFVKSTHEAIQELVQKAQATVLAV